jgi:hypothetical protein
LSADCADFYHEGEEKMGTKDKERRVYSKEFKVEAVTPAGKHEKPVRRVAVDLGVNENIPYRWIRQSREAGGTDRVPFPGHGRPRGDGLWQPEGAGGPDIPFQPGSTVLREKLSRVAGGALSLGSPEHEPKGELLRPSPAPKHFSKR